MVCSLGLVLGGTEGFVTSFPLSDSFLVVPRASGPAFIFYAPGLIFGVSKGVESSFHVLRSQTRFRC
jgi:hypothetical protein